MMQTGNLYLDAAMPQAGILMNRLLTAVFLLSVVPLHAQVNQFPYKARVVKNEVYARSGAGEAFYPTQLMDRDTIVTVRRHDPGGWFMIDPPKGSFSWIPQKHVRELNSRSGEVIESNVVVFVGSSFGDETHVWQRKMTAGEEVKVIGQRLVDTLQGPKQMLKIYPPAREFRWVPGSAVVPLDSAKLQQRDNDPYLEPSNMIGKADDAFSTFRYSSRASGPPWLAIRPRFHAQVWL